MTRMLSNAHACAGDELSLQFYLERHGNYDTVHRHTPGT